MKIKTIVLTRHVFSKANRLKSISDATRNCNQLSLKRLSSNGLPVSIYFRLSDQAIGKRKLAQGWDFAAGSINARSGRSTKINAILKSRVLKEKSYAA